jgi:uncharacterized heparinase superfamily protein
LFRKFSLLYHTVKYLKFKQILWRAIYLLPRIIRPINTFPPTLIKFPKCEYISKQHKTDDFLNFNFLNESHNLYEVGWDNENISKLWRYNLHYFEFLLQDNIGEKNQEEAAILEKWIDENEFGKGTAWEPYPTSLRIINCIKWHLKTGKLSDKAMLSLWNQTRWLTSRPEYHLLGNHLFINAKALLFSCAFFQLDENAKIYKKAIKILNAELDEQFLADGAHFELSPMYHSLAMEDLLDLLSISSLLPKSFPKNKIEKKFIVGMQWLKTMIYNNEELSHFNDCANGIAPKYSELKEYASRIGLDFIIHEDKKVNYHSESGFIVFKDTNTHLIADVGHVGPTYLPGHAHADTLSFELAVSGQRIIVNSGTSVYGISPERHRQRSTAAHSTIEVDGKNSSEVWSGFRVAKRAVPFNINVNSVDTSNNFVSFYASHDGYKRLKNESIHKRSWTFNEHDLFVEDEVSGNNNIVISRYYLHPDLKIDISSRGYIISNSKSNLALVEILNAKDIELTDATYHDEFGVSRLNKCIQVKTISPCKIKIRIEAL